MNCGEIREAMRDGFDRGVRRAPEVDAHLDACPGCRAFAARLDDVDRVLGELPGEAVAPEFVTRLRRTVREQHSPWAVQPALLRAGVIFLAMCAILFGWQYSRIAEYANTGWGRLSAWFSVEGAINLEQSIAVSVTAAWDQAVQLLEPAAGVSPLLQWLCVIGSCAALIAWA